MTMKLDRNHHSVLLLYFRVVSVIKYRKEVFNKKTYNDIN